MVMTSQCVALGQIPQIIKNIESLFAIVAVL